MGPLLTARDAFHPQLQQVFTEDFPPRGISYENLIFVVFEPLPRGRKRFLGLVLPHQIPPYSQRIFADLLPAQPPAPAAPDTPLDLILVRMARESLEALPVVDSKRKFLGVVTRERILAVFLERERAILADSRRRQNSLEDHSRRLQESYEHLREMNTASRDFLGFMGDLTTERKMLQKGIEDLARLLDARYGAVGLVNKDGDMMDFIYTGISPEQQARMGRPPEARGLLGAVIRENQTLRLEDMGSDPRAAGFPPGHPPMKSLLAAPVSHAGKVYGRIYLSEKRNGNPFTDEDEHLAAAFANGLGLSIYHRRLQAEKEKAELLLREVAQAVSAETGGRFFRTLVTSLAKSLSVDFAFVGAVDGNNTSIVHTIAVYAHGKIVDNFTYDIKGTPCNNVIGKDVCFYPRDIQRLFPQDKMLADMGIESYIGYPLRDSSGTVLGLLVVMHGKPLANKQPAQSILQICSVRAEAELERLRTEDAIRRSEENLRSLAENANDGILVNLDGRHVFANPRLAQMLGYTVEEIQQTTLKDLVHPEEYERVNARFRKRMEGKKAGKRYETRFISKDGAGIPVELTTAMTRWHGKPAGLVFVHDIRDRLKSETQMRLLSSVIEQTADAVVITDRAGIIEYVNPGYEAQTGYSREETMGKKPNLVKSGEHSDKFYQTLWQTILAGRVYHNILTNRRKDGSIYYEAKTITPIKDRKGEITHFVSTGRDITDIIRTQEELRKSQRTLSTLMRNLPGMVYRCKNDQHWTMEFASEGCMALTGYHVEDLKDNNKISYAELIHPDDRETVAGDVEGAIREGRQFQLTYRIRTVDGQEKWVWEQGRAVYTETGEVAALEGYIGDITAHIHAEEEIHNSEERFRQMAETIEEVFWLSDPARKEVIYVSPAYEKIWGRPCASLYASARTWLDAIHPDDRERVIQAMLSQQSGGSYAEIYRIIRPDGSERWIADRAFPVRDTSGKVYRIAGIAQDITERKHTEDKLSRLGRIIDDSSNEIYVFDADNLRFIQVNRGARRNLGYTMEELRKLTPLDLKPELSQEKFLELLRPLRENRQAIITFETVHRRKDGSLYPVEVRLQLSRTEQPPVFVAILQDISERKRTEEHLSYLAYYDSLTGLPNRTLMRDRLKQAIADANRRNRSVAVMFLDLDRFKIVNDSLGHDVGDALLKAVGERLAASVRPGDTVARLGGDEFMIIFSNVGHVDDVTRVAQKIMERFIPPFRIAGRELFINPSMGITLYPFDDNDPDTLIKNADAAMYHAKDHGRNRFQFFTSELNQRVARRLELETSLRRALERKEFLLHYQPLVDLHTGRITGMEALLRWQHPEHGMIQPVEFIPLAEDTGLIVPIGEWVMQTACAQLKSWHKAGFKKLRMAVNLSGRQLQNKYLPDLVAQILEEAGLGASSLELELTEGILMQDIEEMITVLQGLDNLGVFISMDDFGTGYSSLSYLKRLPIDTLKIDRSFVQDIPGDPDSAAIARTIIAMAHSLDIRVIAEGVETSQQLDFLRTHECDGMQGYYFSRPVSAAAFTKLLKENRRLARRPGTPKKNVKRKNGKKRKKRTSGK